MWLLTYDTWNEDQLVPGAKCYREVEFPTPSEAQFVVNSGATTPTFERYSNQTEWKLIGFSFLHINGNPRCDAPLPDVQDPSDVVHSSEFNLVMTGQGEQGRQTFSTCSRVCYAEPGDPNTASDSVAIASGSATLHIDRDRCISFRTYKDVAAPDGYIASKVVQRVYSVFSANKNIKKNADGASVTMVNGVVTHVIDSDRFYIEERDKRLFGIQVRKTGHGVSRNDEIEVVVGSIETDPSNGERYVAATSVTEYGTSSIVRPLYMDNRWIGGASFAPAGGSGTNYGQGGVTGGKGTNTVGMLVCTAGVVTGIDSSSPPAWFTVSDGSAVTDAAGNAGVRISAAGIVPSGLQVGDYYSATGVCQAQCSSGSRFPIILARDSSDLVKH